MVTAAPPRPAPNPTKTAFAAVTAEYRWLDETYSAWIDRPEPWQADQPPGPRWAELWGRMEMAQAAERSARRATGYEGCVFGPGARCPVSAPVSCDACAGGNE